LALGLIVLGSKKKTSTSQTPDILVLFGGFYGNDLE
jgi:hypothetical protein